MRGVYLTYIPSSEGQRKLILRLEDHVILPDLGERDVMIQVKACGLSRIDTKIIAELLPSVEQISVGYEVSGVVTKVGSAVRLFSVADEVAGVLPVDTECPGCAEYCVVPEFFLVRKPAKVNHIDCAATLTAGVRAHTALRFKAHVKSGSITLVCSAATSDGLTTIQMCEAIGAKVIAAVSSPDEAGILKHLHPSLLTIFDFSTSQNLVEVCMQQTGGLGVNVIIDNGVSHNYFLSDFLIESVPLKQQLEKEACRYGYEADSSSILTPTKHQLISCLAARGQWVTSQPDLQLDPPESQLLFMKGASLHFLFDPVWTLSGAQQGDYLSILDSVMKGLEKGSLKPYVYKTVALDQVCEEMLRLGTYGIGKIVMRTV